MKRSVCQFTSSFGDRKQACDDHTGAHQQKLSYQTVNGSTINLDVINHQPLVCQEFIVTSPKFNYYRWMAWTVGFYALGYILQLHLQAKTSLNLGCILFVSFLDGIISVFISILVNNIS